MSRGDKAKKTTQKKAKAKTLQAGHKELGVAKKEAERRAWDTVNKQDRAGKKKTGGTRKKTAGTAGGRSKVTKRASTSTTSTRKTKTTGKTRPLKRRISL